MLTSAQLKPTIIEAAALLRQQYDDFRTLNTTFMKVWRTGEIDKVWNEYRATDKRAWLTYFIRARGMGDIKIGKSNHVRERLQSLFTGASRGVDLVACYPAPITHEKELHAEFEHLRLCGEWFRPGQELLDHLTLVGCDVDAFTNVVPAHFYRRFPERMS